MRLANIVNGVRQGDLRPVFCGGTSLSKGYGLIQRFSEDLDFKLLLPEAGIERAVRRRYRTALIEAVRANGDWMLRDDDVLVGNESRFLRCPIGYPNNFAPAPALRTSIRLDVTLAPPALSPEDRSLRSFVAEARKEDPEVPRIACVAPAETAADKLSALTWRVLTRQRGREDDDATLIRHLHILAALEAHAMEHRGFPELVTQLLAADAPRGAPAAVVATIAPVERVMAALDILATDFEYRNEYERFVGAMCYGNESETPAFESALEAVHRLGQILN